MRLFGICCSLIIDNFDKLSRGFLEEDKIQLFIIWTHCECKNAQNLVTDHGGIVGSNPSPK